MNDYKKYFFLWFFWIRIALIFVAWYVDDNTPTIRYTDTDYDVFTDAAGHVYNGDSPFKRHTYRYTPLAAYICLPNQMIHYYAGKFVFCFFDMIMAMFMWNILESQTSNKYWIFAYVSYIIQNPITVALSTRGSNDNIIIMLVYGTIFFLLKRRYVLAGLMYGLSVHFKIYPIIYSIPFYLFIDCDREAILEGKKSWSQIVFKNFFTRNRVVFTLVSATTFLSLTGFFYSLYGFEFLYEGYLYHFVRKDNRHNYSVYFLMIYNMMDLKANNVLALMAFIPQWSVVLAAGFTLYHDLFFAITIQTWAFVAFNKVVTLQYFLWFFALVPFAAVNNKLFSDHPIRGLFLQLLYLYPVLWGKFAYEFEFMGLNTINEMQIGNFCFFFYNVIAIILLSRHQVLTITPEIEGPNSIEAQQQKLKDKAKKE